MTESGPNDDPRPIVRLPRSRLSAPMIAGVGLIAAASLFYALEAQRRSGPVGDHHAAMAIDAFPAPPALIVPPVSVSEPAERPILSVPAPMPGEAPKPQATAPTAPPRMALPQTAPPVILASPPIPNFARAAPEVRPRLMRSDDDAPALIIDGGMERKGDGGSSATGLASLGGHSPVQNPDAAPIQAMPLANRTMVMPTGTMIPAILETPIDTARPGLVRAVVSGDARGFDGHRVLVPRGTRLIGEYQTEVRGGQDRVLVTWNRLIRPDGVTIPLSSPAADALGTAGIPGKVHSFFLERFGAALLQSALTVGVNLASRPGNGSVIVGLPTGQINNTVGQTLLPNDLRPKITVKQGSEISVFVARDLDFSVASPIR